MQMAENEERKNREKIQSLPIQICQSPGPFLSPFKTKKKITFFKISGIFGQKKQSVVKGYRVKIKI